MCSTPRHSRSMRGSNRASAKSSVGKIDLRSYSDMLRTASVQYEERQRERIKRQKALLEQENEGFN
ncbi:MAG: hypothetical protein GY694_02405 [Gammaproteobacteria bacterium]|nr:hypothetical protein [Gammaproteobacteria bacterium]